MIKKFDDLTVVEFGNGTVTVELGKYGSQYAVFINNTDTPGMPGQLAPKTKNPRGYEPDEIVLVFPTKKRAAGVVNSLFNGELVKVEGRQHPAPAVQGEPTPAGFALIKLDSRTGKPLVTSEMKVKHIGEYWWDEEAPYYDEHGDLHDYVARHVVPWSLCKEIYKSMASTAMLSVQPAEQQPAPDVQGEPVAWYLPSEAGYDSCFRDHATIQACTANPWTGWLPLYLHPQPAPGVSELVEALEEISDPIRFMQERLEEGEQLNGMAAVQLAEDASYLRGIAKAALAAHRKGGEL